MDNQNAHTCRSWDELETELSIARPCDVHRPTSSCEDQSTMTNSDDFTPEKVDSYSLIAPQVIDPYV